MQPLTLFLLLLILSFKVDAKYSPLVV